MFIADSNISLTVLNRHDIKWLSVEVGSRLAMEIHTQFASNCDIYNVCGRHKAVCCVFIDVPRSGLRV